ncbi:MarR family winged helix-turn-helix transcriptional regulator [Frankia sp. QA3]|uniref:MarR family winged helix-turn-helix transcriptional regulator n=1 Tax=Frankia sp. QA3 TaxID=710111 RepID=UPI000269C2C8|nr:MarR family transcriptional regulator [Frankia sp. QA3]EIV91093.1 transcriptional regulator [Frankia sp. QA3]
MHYLERLLAYVKRAEQATQAAKETVLREVGLTPAQQTALAAINDAPGITAAELARRCAVTPQTTNSLVGRLQGRGLVERSPHPLHGTLIELRLTEHGRALFARADALVAKLDADLSAALSPTELDTLRDLLTRVAVRAVETTGGAAAR